MKCYKCAESGVETDAVGICVVCGMGLCMDHANMTEISLWEAHQMDGVPLSALGIEKKKETKVPRILCELCYTRVEDTRNL